MRSKSTNKDDASSSGKAHGKKSKSSQGTQPAKTEFANTLSALMHESWAQLSARPTQSHTSSYDTHDTPKDWTSAQKHDTSSEEEKDDDNASIISYEDELGRSRRGTRAQAARAAALKEDLNDEPQRPSWQPEQPKNLIHGVTVQTEAFNPDARLAAHMAHIAELRDRSSSPELVHYDADADPRKRGAGFYNFSKDEAERRRQMEELEKARAETEDAAKACP
ncbi:hypothetical protein N7470_002249 [Penicillium chermesinum]|nr:hypothetical protein N7470_002249 [Penicillium chermesinum]